MIAHNLVARLLANRDMLTSYGDQHIAKDPPQVEKAEVNYRAAGEINLAILDHLRSEGWSVDDG